MERSHVGPWLPHCGDQVCQNVSLRRGVANKQTYSGSHLAKETTMKILLSIDQSPFSTPPLRAVASRPWPAGSLVRVLTVVETVLPVVPEVAIAADFTETHEALRKAGREAVAFVASRLETVGLQVETRVREGNAGREIVEEAKQWGADLVLVGSHGRTGLDRLLMGSVAEYVVSHAECSVEVVRATPAELAQIQKDG